jgi:hypothetical protein
VLQVRYSLRSPISYADLDRLQRFRDELEQLYLTEGYTHQQLAHWLADRGLVVAPPNP